MTPPDGILTVLQIVVRTIDRLPTVLGGWSLQRSVTVYSRSLVLSGVNSRRWDVITGRIFSVDYLLTYLFDYTQ